MFVVTDVTLSLSSTITLLLIMLFSSISQLIFPAGVSKAIKVISMLVEFI